MTVDCVDSYGTPPRARNGRGKSTSSQEVRNVEDQ